MGKCYCGSGKKFDKCCQKFIEKSDIPSTPRELIQSRFTAYCLKSTDYISFTNSDNVNKVINRELIFNWMKIVDFVKLEINSEERDEYDLTHAMVEFKVYFMVGDTQHIHYETAHIIRKKGRWQYDGVITDQERVKKGFKITLNDECICGSGKLFKECCMEL